MGSRDLLRHRGGGGGWRAPGRAAPFGNQKKCLKGNNGVLGRGAENESVWRISDVGRAEREHCKRERHTKWLRLEQQPTKAHSVLSVKKENPCRRRRRRRRRRSSNSNNINSSSSSSSDPPTTTGAP